jgi:hypothetical protein
MQEGSKAVRGNAQVKERGFLGEELGRRITLSQIDECGLAHFPGGSRCPMIIMMMSAAIHCSASYYTHNIHKQMRISDFLQLFPIHVRLIPSKSFCPVRPACLLALLPAAHLSFCKQVMPCLKVDLISLIIGLCDHHSGCILQNSVIACLLSMCTPYCMQSKQPS